MTLELNTGKLRTHDGDSQDPNDKKCPPARSIRDAGRNSNTRQQSKVEFFRNLILLYKLRHDIPVRFAYMLHIGHWDGGQALVNLLRTTANKIGGRCWWRGCRCWGLAPLSGCWRLWRGVGLNRYFGRLECAVELEIDRRQVLRNFQISSTERKKIEAVFFGTPAVSEIGDSVMWDVEVGSKGALTAHFLSRAQHQTQGHLQHFDIPRI